MKNTFLLILLIYFSQPLQTNPRNNVKIDLENYLKLAYEEQLPLRNIIKNDSELYLYKIVKKTFESEYECCVSHLKKHSSYLDLLVYLYREFDNELLILEYASEFYTNPYNKNAQRWSSCIKSLYKKDCRGSKYHIRLSSFPFMLKDTFSFESSSSIIQNIAYALSEESCWHLLDYLQSNQKWRKGIFNALILQLETYGGKDEDFDYDVYEIMRLVPDKLTSNYAYNQFMKHGFSTHEQLLEITYDRAAKYSYKWYDRYLGGDIIFSDDKIRQIKNKIIEIQDSKNSKICQELLERLKEVD